MLKFNVVGLKTCQNQSFCREGGEREIHRERERERHRERDIERVEETKREGTWVQFQVEAII